MNLYFKLLLILLCLIYIISPFDFLPDMIPFLGRGDDLFLLFMLIYYLVTGKLPRFLNRRRPSGSYSRSYRQKTSNTSAGGTRSDRGKEKKDSGAKDNAHESAGKKTSWDPYEVLGVKPGATPEEIQTAYRHAVQKYHPDKVSHLGTEFQELAKKKFIEIQKAYEELYPKR